MPKDLGQTEMADWTWPGRGQTPGKPQAEPWRKDSICAKDRSPMRSKELAWEVTQVSGDSRTNTFQDSESLA